MKKLKDTKIGNFLTEKAPGVLNIVGDLLPDGGTLGIVKNAIDMVVPDPEEREAIKAEMNEMALEFYKTEVADRDSARKREIEMAKAGKQDWMMLVTGLVGLLSFCVMVYAVIWVDGVQENKLFVHLMGIIEGVVISNLFAYYYGTSKSSKDKDIKLK
jgi:hypothetical protein